MKKIEKLIFHSRWLLLPLYVGLVASLLAFPLKFWPALLDLFSKIFKVKDTEFILSVLSLIDLVLVGNLLIMVIISSYETFIQPLILGAHADHPKWLHKLDPGTVKIKVASSIVAISSIHLLTVFLNLHNSTREQNIWLVIMHLTFVVSALCLCIMDRISSKDGEL